MGHRGESDGLLSDMELEAPITAKAREASDGVVIDPSQVALAVVCEPKPHKPHKHMKKCGTQKLAMETPACSDPLIMSSRHFETLSGGYGEELVPSHSQTSTSTCGNNRWHSIQTPAEPTNKAESHWMGNVTHSRSFNHSPEFFTLIRQTMREEIECFYHWERPRLEKSLSSCPSSPEA